MSDPFYRSREWRELRERRLRIDGGLCVVPGCGKRATHVDHIVSRRDGGRDTIANLRSLCAGHDNQIKEAATGKRRSGGVLHVKGCDAQGAPRDPGHWWWNK